MLLKTDTLHVRCDIYFIQMGQVFADVEHGRIEGGDVVCVPPVVPLTLGDVARFDVLGCFCCCCHISAFADLLYNWSSGYRGGALIGGCRERVTSCSGVLGADATERSVQREGHSLEGAGRESLPAQGSWGQMPLSGASREKVTLWSGFSGVKLMSEVSGQRPEQVKGSALWVLRAKP